MLQNQFNYKVSVILPNYNHSAYLKPRLESILNQTYHNFELIILDDASTDNSHNMLKAYRNHPKVSHFEINERNTGSPFRQWLKGIKVAKGDFIWIAESDDFCKLDFLETQVRCLENSDVAVAKTMATLEDTVISEVKHPVFDQSKQDNKLLFCPILNVSSILFKSELVKPTKNQNFCNFKIIGDRVFYYEYFQMAKIVFNAATINYFRQSNNSISKLNHRSLSYYQSYFYEHSRFISLVKKRDSKVSHDFVRIYLNKFYSRVRDRVTPTQKRSIRFMLLYLHYKMKIWFN